MDVPEKPWRSHSRGIPIPLIPLIPLSPIIPPIPLIPLLPFIPFLPFITFIPFLPFLPFSPTEPPPGRSLSDVHQHRSTPYPRSTPIPPAPQHLSHAPPT